MAFLPRKTVISRRTYLPFAVAPAILIVAFFAMLNFAHLLAQEQAVSEQDYEREELGVNPYTAPSITRIFQQLDELKPLPFDQLRRDYPQPTHGGREQMALVFGGLIGDGFFLVACEKKNLFEDFGRVLLRQAQSLSVADRVTRHSASVTELAQHGDWPAVRNELIATQADVERAMVELRDQKVAHLISLGGWLRGLEICAGAIEADFSPDRARVLAQPDLINYFYEELKTLSPAVAHGPLFQKMRAGLSEIKTTINSMPPTGLSLAEVKKIHEAARELNRAIQATH
jgi:hypothetical protein